MYNGRNSHLRRSRGTVGVKKPVAQLGELED